MLPVPLDSGDGSDEDEGRVALFCVCGITDTEALRPDAAEYKAALVKDVVGANIRNAVAHTETARLASEDALTGIKNRRTFEEALRSEWERFRRHDCEFCVAVIDLDRFKEIHDTHGHPAGDKVLRAVAEALTAASRQCDFVARLGGDEFVILLSETDVDGASVAVSRVVGELSSVQTPAGVPIPTVSIGIASARGKDSPAAPFQAADAALYKSKQGGRRLISTE